MICGRVDHLLAGRQQAGGCGHPLFVSGSGLGGRLVGGRLAAELVCVVCSVCPTPPVHVAFYSCVLFGSHVSAKIAGCFYPVIIYDLLPVGLRPTRRSAPGAGAE